MFAIKADPVLDTNPVTVCSARLTITALSLTRSTSPGPGPLLTIPSQDRLMIPAVLAACACCAAMSMRAIRRAVAIRCIVLTRPELRGHYRAAEDRPFQGDIEP